ncbi:Double-stranded RNA-binding protein Staufen like 2 [Dissostichus eleginoides]|uniref:Double-stranded RNA-binding protein Staufen like 2 n=1 Tax=Dissostichus eleginoides TaxID=100907 RepID=A0AAD9F110_DISEL|nr:Double-stranded RNA-binding protein Staufen like 2 [Dissostichus eleginoides]
MHQDQRKDVESPADALGLDLRLERSSSGLKLEKGVLLGSQAGERSSSGLSSWRKEFFWALELEKGVLLGSQAGERSSSGLSSWRKESLALLFKDGDTTLYSLICCPCFRAALSALKQLSEQGLDPVDGAIKRPWSRLDTNRYIQEDILTM